MFAIWPLNWSPWPSITSDERFLHHDCAGAPASASRGGSLCAPRQTVTVTSLTIAESHPTQTPSGPERYDPAGVLGVTGPSEQTNSHQLNCDAYQSSEAYNYDF